MAEEIRLGAFVLESPISSGGMGTVWRARHELTEAPVAVKVIAGTHAQNPVYLDGFEREVRAVSHMEHPRIIRVYDFGFVDSAAERSSGGELGRRSPWLAMELATRGSLAQLPGIGDFETLKAILFDILDALAHSHARGIIHRDLKPGNVLLAETSTGVHCKLTDFGISHAAGRSMSTREVFATSAGTPWYMAPEQVDSRWRDYGPWTDLYALGCVAYQLASGDTPFVGKSAVRIARQQLFDRPPPLEPRFEVPEAFSSWVDRLLVKEIHHRFRRAADAAWALHQISARDDDAIVLNVNRADPDVSGTDTTALHTGDNYTTSVATLTFLSGEHDAPPPPAPAKFSVPGSMLTFSVPPVPKDWRLHDDEEEAWLPGSGLGLYRLRAVPFVGREAERDAIWRELRAAVTNRQVRVVVLRGGPGCGKSRLARWVSQRTHELGAASVTEAHHGPIGGEAHGLGPMFSRYLGCGRLDFERTYLRIRRLLTTETPQPPEVIGYHAAATAKLIHPTGEAAGVPAVQFTSAEERYRIMHLMATTIAERRALMAVLDDVHWGYDALELTRRLLDSERPAVILLTVRPDQLISQPLEAEILREIEAHPNTTTLEIEPLSRAEQGTLVDKMLTLEPTLREEVLDRTAGSPLFAAELLGDWVRRRVLRASPHGFRIDATEEIPNDIHGLWNRRFEKVIEQMRDADAARAAIEVGAALGTSVAHEEWREACAKLDIDIDHSLVDQLVAAGLLEHTETGWTFQHQMLRESIAEGARAAARASAQHRVVADMLEFDEAPDSQLRRALHFLAVDDWLSAAPPLLVAVEDMVATGRMREAAAVLKTLEEVLEHVPEDHQVRRRALEARLTVLRQFGDRERIAQFIDETRPAAQRHGWQSTLAHLLRTEAAFAVESGGLEEGKRLLTDALNHARLSREPAQLAATHRALGFVAVRFNDLKAARAHFETSRDHYQMAGKLESVSKAMVGLAQVELIAGNIDAARRYNDEAIRICRQGGFRILLANHLCHRGDVASVEQDYETAVRFYEEAMQLARLTDNHHIYPIAVLNLGVTLTYLGDHERAKQRLDEAHALLSANDLTLYAYFAELGMLWNDAPHDPTAWDADYETVLEGATPNMALRESVEHTLAAGQRWRDAGDMRRAAAAFELARRLIPEGFVESLGPRVDAALQESSKLAGAS